MKIHAMVTKCASVSISLCLCFSCMSERGGCCGFLSAPSLNDPSLAASLSNLDTVEDINVDEHTFLKWGADITPEQFEKAWKIIQGKSRELRSYRFKHLLLRIIIGTLAERYGWLHSRSSPKLLHDLFLVDVSDETRYEHAREFRSLFDRNGKVSREIRVLAETIQSALKERLGSDGEEYISSFVSDCKTLTAFKSHAVKSTLQNLFGDFGYSRMYGWVVGPLVEEWGAVGLIIAYPLILAYRICGLMSHDNLIEINEAIIDILEIIVVRKGGLDVTIYIFPSEESILISSLILGYRGTVHAIGSSIFYINPAAGLVILAVLYLYVGYRFIKKYEKGKKKAAAVVAISASAMMMLPFIGGWQAGFWWFLLAPVGIHSLVNIAQTIRGRNPALIDQSAAPITVSNGKREVLRAN